MTLNKAFGVATYCAGLMLIAISGFPLDSVAKGPPVTLTKDSDLDYIQVIQGKRYGMRRGYAYEARGNKWERQSQMYDPDFLKKNYVLMDGKVLRRHPSDANWLIPTYKEFEDKFNDVIELIGAHSHGS